MGIVEVTSCCGSPEWQTALATWWLFVATALLVAITGGGLTIAYRSAKAAIDAFRLEAEPVIVVRVLRTEPSEKPEFLADDLPEDAAVPPFYIVAGTPTIDAGVAVRPYDAAKDDPGNPYAAKNASRRKKRQGLVLEFENVGRSPAVDVTIKLAVRVAFPLRGERQERCGGGEIQFTALVPGSPVRLELKNDLGISVACEMQPFGAQRDALDHRSKKKKIAVVANLAKFTLRATDGAP